MGTGMLHQLHLAPLETGGRARSEVSFFRRGVLAEGGPPGTGKSTASRAWSWFVSRRRPWSRGRLAGSTCRWRHCEQDPLSACHCIGEFDGGRCPRWSGRIRSPSTPVRRPGRTAFHHPWSEPMAMIRLAPRPGRIGMGAELARARRRLHGLARPLPHEASGSWGRWAGMGATPRPPPDHDRPQGPSNGPAA